MSDDPISSDAEARIIADELMGAVGARGRYDLAATADLAFWIADKSQEFSTGTFASTFLNVVAHLESRLVELERRVNDQGTEAR